MPDKSLTAEKIEHWLREENPDRLDELWRAADETRRQTVGDAVHLRGLLEISNHCVRTCAYCGLSRHNRQLKRYRMSAAEILAGAREAMRFGYGTVVLQAGEDYGLAVEWLTQVVRRIKNETPLAVTLSLGERPLPELEALREAGADRYLLRFETSDRRLYEVIHPSTPVRKSDRVQMLQELRRLGYEIGGGVMIGLPGQTYATLARDIEWFNRLDLDMIGVGPYLVHPETPLGREEIKPEIDPREQTPATDTMAYKVIALARLVCPEANIPSTTALAVANRKEGRMLGLQRGANVVMPNLTPASYRIHYEIYPEKACLQETAEAGDSLLRRQLRTIGRTAGVGPGSRKKTERPFSSLIRNLLMKDGKPLILCVDDDPDVLDHLRMILEGNGYYAVTASNAEEGFAKYREKNPDLVIVDLMMETIDAGHLLIKNLRAMNHTAPLLMLSSVGDALQASIDTAELGISAVIQKPVQADSLLNILRAKLK